MAQRQCESTVDQDRTKLITTPYSSKFVDYGPKVLSKISIYAKSVQPT